MTESHARSLIERVAAAYDLGAQVRPVAASPPLAQADAPAVAMVPAAAPFEDAPIGNRQGIVDVARLRAAGYVLPDAPVSALAEEVRIVKRQLLVAAGRPDASARDRVILIASAQPDEGKTFCAVNLALSMAIERDHEVLLVDADVAKPSILSTLGLEAGPGLIDALADPGLDPEACVIRTDVGGLSVLPAGARVEPCDRAVRVRSHARCARSADAAAAADRAARFAARAGGIARVGTGAARRPGGARRPRGPHQRGRAARGGRAAVGLPIDPAPAEQCPLQGGRAAVRLLLRAWRVTMRGFRRLALLGGVACAATASAEPRRVVVTPYVEADQVLATRLSGDDFGDDVVTYTTVAAGVDAQIATRRVEAGVTFRYEHQFGYGHNAGDTDRYDGLARLNVHVLPNLLDFEAGAIATRTRYDIRGAAPNPNVGDPANITQLYSVYLGPSLAKSVGLLDLTASYRFGYTKVEDKLDRGSLPDDIDRGGYGHSTSHTATASVGMRPGDLPFGWTVSGAYYRENTQQLDGRFIDKLVRLDVTLPVTPTLALIGGVGYEDLTSTQDTPLFTAGGQIAVDNRGRFIADPTQPRLLAYDNDGLYYDVGVVWKPSPRTTLIATVGERYGGLAVTGSFNHQIDSSSVIQIGVYNVVDSFGRSLDRNLAAVPTTFVVPRNPFTNALGGCVFSTDPRNGPGGCFNDSFQSITAVNFRSRGVYALYSAGRGPVRLGIGGGYSQRRYLVPAGFSPLFATHDQSWNAQANLSLRVSPRTTWENVIEIDYFQPGGLTASDVLTGSATSALYHSFTGHLTGTAAAGIYAFDPDGFATDVSGQLLLGVRYQF